LGELPPKQLHFFQLNEFTKGLKIPEVTNPETIEAKVPLENLTSIGMDFLKVSLFGSIFILSFNNNNNN